MNINITEKVDYKHLMMLDSWSCKEAALIICGFDPDSHRHIRFSPKLINQNSNPELVPALKLYKVFESVNNNRSYDKKLNHPISFLVECKKKDWPVSDELITLARERHQRENPMENDNTEERQAISQAKNSILKTLGAVVMLYVSEKKDTRKFGTTNDITVSQITEKIMDFLAKNNYKIHGLGQSSLNDKIGQAIKVFQRSLE